MSKGRRRREARRRAKQRRQEQGPERPPRDEDAEAASSQGRPGGEGEPVRTVERAGARRGRSARKRAKSKGGLGERVGRIRVSPWMIAVPALLIGTGVLAVLILTSGSSGTTVGVAPTPTPDPRVAGKPVTETIAIAADDDGANPAASSFFQPNSVTAKAGDVIEFVLTNNGSVTHNIWLAGADNEYDTDDDFGPIELIGPGETGSLVVTIEEPGTYNFRCQIHPQVQFGTLELS